MLRVYRFLDVVAVCLWTVHVVISVNDRMCHFCEIGNATGAEQTEFYEEHVHGTEVESRTLKFLDIISVGDASCGKTSLMKAMKMKPHPERPQHIHYKYHVFHNEPYLLTSKLVDDRSHDEPRERRIWYFNLGGAVLVLCYSIDSRESFTNLVTKWLPEIRATFKIKSLHTFRIILVGLKKDLRFAEKETQSEFVSNKEGEKMAKKIGASYFIECSSLSGEGLDEVLRKVFIAFNEDKPNRLRRMLKFCLPL